MSNYVSRLEPGLRATLDLIFILMVPTGLAAYALAHDAGLAP